MGGRFAGAAIGKRLESAFPLDVAHLVIQIVGEALRCLLVDRVGLLIKCARKELRDMDIVAQTLRAALTQELLVRAAHVPL